MMSCYVKCFYMLLYLYHILSLLILYAKSDDVICFNKIVLYIHAFIFVSYFILIYFRCIN